MRPPAVFISNILWIQNAICVIEAKASLKRPYLVQAISHLTQLTILNCCKQDSESFLAFRVEEESSPVKSSQLRTSGHSENTISCIKLTKGKANAIDKSKGTWEVKFQL